VKITLKNLKIHRDMSEETTCFSATVYVDGKKVGIAKNDGRGGCNMYYWEDYGFGRKVEEWAKTLPPRKVPSVSMPDLTVSCDLDILIGEIMDKQEEDRWVKRQCRNKTLFRIEGDPADSYRTVKHVYDAGVKAFIEGKYGDAVVEILNERAA